MKIFHVFLPLVVLIFTNFLFSAGNASENDGRGPVAVGFFLTSIYEVQSSAGTFSADLWVWSRAPKDQNFNLSLLEVSPLNGKYPLHAFGEYIEELADSTVYSSRKLRGTFLHDYNLTKFPFDRQVLRIILESTEESVKHKFVVDPESDYDQRIRVPGWEIVSVKLVPGNRIYGTNFGYPPGNKDASYASVVVEIELSRNSPLLFWKISIGLFVAVVIALFSAILSVARNELFGSRLALLGGTLLAAVINQQFADSKAGETTAVTVIDSIHFFGIVAIGAVFLSSVVLRHFYNQSGDSRSIEKYDRTSCMVLFVFFTTSVFLSLVPVLLG